MTDEAAPRPVPTPTTQLPTPTAGLSDAGPRTRSVVADLLIRAERGWSQTWTGAGLLLPTEHLTWARLQPSRKAGPLDEVLRSFDDVVAATPMWFDSRDARGYVLALVGAGVTGASLPLPDAAQRIPTGLYLAPRGWHFHRPA